MKNKLFIYSLFFILLLSLQLIKIAFGFSMGYHYTIWGVLKPLWDDRRVRIQIRIFESDSGLRGSQHKDEEMDIRTGAGKDFVFEFDPRNMSYSVSLGTKVWSIPAGFFIKSDGEGDLRARIYVKVWTMGDKKEEIFYPIMWYVPIKMRV
ncbi:MAG: hypothetical protein ACP5J9_07365 [Dictyoglomus sp.]